MARGDEALKPLSEAFRFAQKEVGGKKQLFEDWFEDFTSRPLRLWRPESWCLRRIGFEVPAMDIYEEKDALIVKAEIPGLTRDEINISLDGRMLTIKGENKKEKEDKEEHFYRCERTLGAFSRTVELPLHVEPADVDASFTNGVLELRLRKAESKKIVIRVKVA